MTSYNPMAWVVKRTKLNSKKGVMWDTLLWKPFWFSGRLKFHRHSSLDFAGANALRQKLQNILLTFSQISVTLQIKNILLQRLNLWQLQKYFVQMFIFVTTSKIQRKRTPPLFFRDSYENKYQLFYRSWYHPWFDRFQRYKITKRTIWTWTIRQDP